MRKEHEKCLEMIFHSNAHDEPNLIYTDLESVGRPVEHLVTEDQDWANGGKFVIVLRPPFVLVFSSHHVNIEFLTTQPFVEFSAPILHQRA